MAQKTHKELQKFLKEKVNEFTLKHLHHAQGNINFDFDWGTILDDYYLSDHKDQYEFDDVQAMKKRFQLTGYEFSQIDLIHDQNWGCEIPTMAIDEPDFTVFKFQGFEFKQIALLLSHIVTVFGDVMDFSINVWGFQGDNFNKAATFYLTIKNDYGS